MSDDSTKDLKRVATQIDRIDDQHLPALFRSADQAALTAQGRHLRFQKCHLGSLVLVSITAAMIPVVPGRHLAWLYGGVAILVTVGVILALISHSRKDDKTWFDCRAVAESVKTVAWRFMMRVVPFEDDRTATNQFISKIQEIREARSSIAVALATSLNAGDQAISESMNNVRAIDVRKRKSLYLESRVLDQKTWYSNGASFNSRRRSGWFWSTTVLQIIAVSLAIVQVVSSGFAVNLVPILTTCAAAAIAWSQMKRHGELAQTYTVAAQELGDQEAMSSDLMEESAFVRFVEQVEETISREHSMWCARREVLGKLSNTGS